ncbi:MAG: hypothetical protein DRR19_04420 [Candidatus Parabeggiatoa sp. nov. 1]|nr:MAG: hypothetical protein DRR19_04420 [Gammaproteobacteria bacterium]
MAHTIRCGRGCKRGVLNINTFIGLFFFSLRPINGGDGGQAGGKIWGDIEFIVARLPTLRIWGE